MEEEEEDDDDDDDENIYLHLLDYLRILYYVLSLFKQRFLYRNEAFDTYNNTEILSLLIMRERDFNKLSEHVGTLKSIYIVFCVKFPS